MTTDKELYFLEEQFVSSFVKFANIEPKGIYTHKSLEIKKLSTRMDCIYEPSNPDDPVIFIENQGYKEASFYLRYNQGVGLCCNKINHYGEVIKIALFIDKESYNSAKMPKYNNDFIVYIFSEMSIDDLKAFNDKGLMILAPLCKATEQELISLFNKLKKEMPKTKGYSKISLDNIFGIFGYLFGEKHNKTPEQISKLLGVDIMKGQLAQEIERRGIEKGKAEGIEKGIEKGILLLKRLYNEGIITKKRYLEEVEKLKNKENLNNIDKDKKTQKRNKQVKK